MIRKKELDKMLKKYKVLEEIFRMTARKAEGNTTAIIFIMNVTDKGDNVEICYTTPLEPRQLKYTGISKYKLAGDFNRLTKE